MVALVCDICGEKLTMGAGGIATCNNCGMQYNAERIREKIRENNETNGASGDTGTIESTQSGMSDAIDRLLGMAKSAHAAGNNLEAEIYCNKVLEADPSNYEAWIIKGQAAAWQSSLANSRINEGIQFIARGINYAPDEYKQSLLDAAETEISNLLVAMNKLRADRFEKWPDSDEASGWMNEIMAASKAHLLFVELTHHVIDRGTILNPIAKTMEQTVIGTWNRCQDEYFHQPCRMADYPDEYRWKKFIEKSNNCITLMECAASCSEDFDDLIHICENLIEMCKYHRDAAYWEFKFMYVGEQWVKYPDPDACYSLNSQGKANLTSKINEYTRKINEIKGKKAAKIAEEARKKREEYWKAHADEKKRLEEERDHLNTEISKKRQEISAIPGKEDIANLQKTIDDLERQKSSLGFFKGKEKKALQSQIDTIKTNQKAIQDKMDATKNVIEREMAPLLSRVNTIQNELTRDR